MAKMICYSLFRLGKIPAKRRKTLENEGILLAEEGIHAWVTFRNYKGPLMFATYRKKWISGSVVLTKKRFAAYCFFSLWPIVEIPVTVLPDDHFRVCANGELTSVTFDAEHYLPGQHGIVTVQFRSAQAREWLDIAHANNAVGW